MKRRWIVERKRVEMSNASFQSDGDPGQTGESKTVRV